MGLLGKKSKTEKQQSTKGYILLIVDMFCLKTIFISL